MNEALVILSATSTEDIDAGVFVGLPRTAVNQTPALTHGVSVIRDTMRAEGWICRVVDFNAGKREEHFSKSRHVAANLAASKLGALLGESIVARAKGGNS